MSRRYDHPVDVRRRDDEPCEFLWRGRLYVIRGVLAHWIETGPWWNMGVGSSADETAARSRAVLDPLARDAEAVLDDSPELALDGVEREVWRVEASAGRTAGSGVYDVSFDWSAGGWTLRRALD